MLLTFIENYIIFSLFIFQVSVVLYFMTLFMLEREVLKDMGALDDFKVKKERECVCVFRKKNDFVFFLVCFSTNQNIY